jgi:uncharacterized protein (TIGR03083 family)
MLPHKALLTIERPESVEVVDLFLPERRSLLALLAALTDEQWNLDMVCPGWTVRDVALHVLGVDLANLSRRRDGFRDSGAPGPVDDSWPALVAFLGRINQSWVEAARRISPRLLCELLAFTGEPMAAYFKSLDLTAMGEGVAWVGATSSPVWLDVAREYTERWVHQQQIRDAVGLPGFTEPEFLALALATFVHALPHTLRDVEAPLGACIRLVITGPAGGRWRALRSSEGWLLGQDREGQATVTVIIGQDTAWRAFTRSIARDEAMARAAFEGDRDLGARVLEMVSIIA